jgi:hypothetical protein
MTARAVVPVSREEIGRRIMRLPPEQQARSLIVMRRLAELGDAHARKGARSHATRDFLKRRRYAETGDPWAYSRDIFGYDLTQQQDEVLELLVRETRVLIPSGNNLGKTFVLAIWGLFRFDAMGALENPDSGEREQGARILLPGPDHDTVFETLYSEMLVHAARAEVRGHLMPGERSELSVNWRVRPMWNMEAFSPPARVHLNVAHTASGRHHRNQIALIEEGQGVPEPTWRAAEGMCSSAGNQIASSFNPTEPVGPAYERATNGNYKVKHLDAFEHPNIVMRRPEIPDAVDYKVVDARVRECRDRGPYPGTPLEPEFGDFVYALARRGTPEHGPRTDDVRGHPDAKPRVYRPTVTFTSQVRGQWPRTSESGLFDPGAIDQSMERWAKGHDPRAIPDGVGLDPAREGDDDPVAAPRWGETAESLLRAFALAEEAGDAALAELRKKRRIRIGELVVFPKSDGVTLAQRVHYQFPDSPFAIDEGAVGASAVDHLARVIGRDVVPVSFAATPLPPLPGEPWSENKRTQLYVRAAMLVNRGIMDLPDDPLLRQELLAHKLEHGARVVERYSERKRRNEKVRVPSVALVAKDEVKKLIGRSPDRADAVVLAPYTEPIAAAMAPIPPTISRRTFR